MMKKYYLFPTTLIFLAITACQEAEQKTDTAFTQETNSVNEKIEIPVIADNTDDTVVDVVDVPKFIPPPPAPIPAFIGGRGDGHRTGNSDDDHNPCHDCDLGTASFSVNNENNDDDDGWYPIDTFSYPQTTVLSINRNGGTTQGDVVLTPTGLQVNEDGTYWVNFTAIVNNPDLENSVFLPLFLVPNGVFDPLNTTSMLGTVGSVPPSGIVSIQGNGLLQNLEEGTTLSILATNGGSQEPQTITIIAWNISIYKICDNGEINPEPIITVINSDMLAPADTQIIAEPGTEVDPMPATDTEIIPENHIHPETNL